MVTRRQALSLLACSGALGPAVPLLAGATTQPDAIARLIEADPLLVLVTQYREALAFHEAAGDLSDKEAAALEQATWGPLYRALCYAPPAATTLEGALAAIRLVVNEEKTCGNQEHLTINVLNAALVYFERGAS